MKEKVFISYSSKDKSTAIKLANDLKNNGLMPWIDLWEIQVGDSIVEKIETAISDTDFLIAIISKNSISSKWVSEELNSAKIREIERGKKFILPVVIDDCKLPPFLSHKRYANFKYSYSEGLIELLTSLDIKLSPQVDVIKNSRDFKDMILKTLELISFRFHVHSSHILFSAEDSHAIRLVMVGAALDDYSQRYRFATMNGIIGYSFNKKEQVYVPNVNLDNRYFQADIRTQSELVSPIINLSGDVIGVVNIESPKTDFFKEEDLLFIQDLSYAIGRWVTENGPFRLVAKQAPYYEIKI